MKFVRNAARNFGVARELVSFFWRKRWAGGPFKPFFGLSGDAPGVKEPTLVAKNATRMGHPPVRVLQFNQIHELGHSLDMITSGSIFGSSEGSADRLLNCIKSNY